MKKILLVSVFFFCAALISESAKKPHLSLSETSITPKIDGILDDECWKKSSKLNDFFIFPKKESGEKNQDTEVFLTRDAQWFYIGLICKNANMNQLLQLGNEHDDHKLYSDDSFEIFLMRENPRQMYYHYVLNFANVQGETRISKNAGHDSGWNTPWLSAVKSGVDSWTAEIAIPLYLLNSETSGDVKINFLRNKVEVTVDNMGMKLGEKMKYSFWSPITKRAHEPENFGTIENMKDFHAEAPFLPGISKTAIGNYKYLNDKISYDVSAEIISFSHVDGKFTLLLQEENKNTGKIRNFTKEGFLSGRSKSNISFNIPTENFSTCDIHLTLKDSVSGAVLQKLNIGTSSSAFLDAYPDRNYYTDEKQVNIRCTFSLPEKILQECSLNINDKGSDLKKIDKLFSETTFPIDLSKLKIGKNTIKLSLNDSKNHIMGEKEIEIMKQPPNPGLEVKTDRFQRIILKNNVPFFPFGIFLSSEFVPIPEYETVLKNFKDNGLNSIIRTMKYEDFYVQSNKAYFDMTSKYKLMTAIWGGNLTPAEIPGKSFEEEKILQRERYEKLLPLIKETVETAKKSSNFLFYYNVDEINLGNWQMRLLVADWFYNTIKELDPYHPVLGLFSSSIPKVKNATDSMDILAFDIYTLPGWSKGVYSDVGNCMAMTTSKLEDTAKSVHKPFLIVPLAGGLAPVSCPYPLSYQEQLCQSYIAIINGARGLLYYSSDGAYSKYMWKSLSDMAAQLKIIAPSILTGRLKQKIDYSPEEFDYKKGNFPSVYGCIFKKPEGGYFLLAANVKDHEVDVKYTVDDLRENISIKNIFSEKKITVDGKTFSDKLEPFGTRTYFIENSLKLPEPVKIHISADKKTSKIAGLPNNLEDKVSAIRKQKNIVPNPSFEECKYAKIPNFFNPWRIINNLEITEKNSEWFLDDENPWHGKYSLKIDRSSHPEKTRYRAALWGAYYPPLTTKPSPYVFSLYMKGKEGGEKVLILFKAGKKDIRKSFELSKDWKRYDIDVTLEMPQGYWDSSYFIIPQSQKTIWVDALQLEKGNKSTDFTLDN